MPAAARGADLVQPVTAGVVGAITGFASSFVLVIAGLRAVGATDAQAASGLSALCFAIGVCCIVLPVWLRVPIATAWSTPGAALLIAAGTGHGDFRAAVGAFLVSGALIVLTGLWPLLGRLMTSIPVPIAAAMLAGILFPICIAPVTAIVQQPLLAAPVVIVWLVLTRFAPRWATTAAMLVAAVAIVATAGGDWLPGAWLPAPQVVVPTLDPLAIVSIGLPLYVVTMAGQNVPGFAVMKTLGYPAPPRAALVTTGVASMAVAPLGGHALNLAAITAAIMAGDEAGEDRRRRWIAAATAGVGYLVLALTAGLMTALVGAAPPILITAVAGLALLGTFGSATTQALAEPRDRLTAVATFLVTASGVSVAGIGSAFWGLVAGFAVLLVTHRRAR